jgi:hypothetical protein
MNVFPAAIGLGYDTNLPPNVHKRVELMKDHSFVIHKDSSDATYDGTIVCLELVEADRTTLETFYTDNEDIPWTFNNPHDGNAYTLFFTAALFFARYQNNATVLYRCHMRVMGTKD